MSDKKHMPVIDSVNEKKSIQNYMKYLEKKNIERAVLAKKVLTQKRAIGIGSFALAIGIYAYTIAKISQETTFDDFDEPPRIIKS